MVVRFEPFLIGAYLFFFRNRTSPVKVIPKKQKNKFMQLGSAVFIDNRIISFPIARPENKLRR